MGIDHKAFEMCLLTASLFRPFVHEKSVARKVSHTSDLFADQVFKFLIEEGVSTPATQQVLAPFCSEYDGFAPAFRAPREVLFGNASGELHM
jgi:hypothetical protein